mmetsp:Transcript_31195/g.76105  ORF Transcript_31195/g.76105 Transcript_31195/m.76105 type:complete len:208 (-) Transcript_31195:93-716(-)
MAFLSVSTEADMSSNSSKSASSSAICTVSVSPLAAGTSCCLPSAGIPSFVLFVRTSATLEASFQTSAAEIFISCCTLYKPDWTTIELPWFVSRVYRAFRRDSCVMIQGLLSCPTPFPVSILTTSSGPREVPSMSSSSAVALFPRLRSLLPSPRTSFRNSCLSFLFFLSLSSMYSCPANIFRVYSASSASPSSSPRSSPTLVSSSPST